MLCRSCRRQVDRGALFCARCGSPQARGMAPALDLVIGDARVPLTQTITLGRGEDCDVTLDDPSVSRHHARVLVNASQPEIEDAGSSHGTLLDDRPVKGRARLQVGSVVRLGDTRIRVERRADDGQVGGRTVMLDAVGGLELSSAGMLHDRVPNPGRPRLGRGCALKQMDEDEGDQRWVLRGGDGGDYLRMGDDEARLIQLAGRRHGAGGAAGRVRAGVRPGRPGPPGPAAGRPGRARHARADDRRPGPVRGRPGPPAAAVHAPRVGVLEPRQGVPGGLSVGRLAALLAARAGHPGRRCRGRRADLPASGADPPRHAVCGRPPAGLGRRRLLRSAGWPWSRCTRSGMD